MKTISITLLRLVLASGLVCAAAFQSGCLIVAAGVAGAGAVAYVRGELSATLDKPYASVVKAADQALADLELRKISEKGDALKTELVARTAGDKKVTITITNTAKSLSKVQIRVGVFGDEALSRMILDKINANL